MTCLRLVRALGSAGTSPSALRPDISVVIPCYNEADNAEAICAAVIAQLEPLGLSFNIVCIDNDSTDDTVAILKRVSAADPRVRVIVNTRNFGQMRSPTHAIYQTDGRCVIGICADFQDPPELLPEFVRRWQAGADIVLAVRQTEENVGFFLKRIRRLSYWLTRNFGDYPIIPNATGFGLYSARVVDATRALAEPEPFFRGMLVETGYRVETIAYQRPVAGSSKRLLRAPLYIGVFGAIMTVLMLLGGVAAFFMGRPIAGWFIAAVVQGDFAVLFGFLGLLGDNVRIISERTRKTPLVIERERVNFPADD